MFGESFTLYLVPEKYQENNKNVKNTLETLVSYINLYYFYEE